MQNNMPAGQQKVEMMKQIFKILLRNGYSLQFPRYAVLNEQAFDSLQEKDIFEMIKLFHYERYFINIENKYTGVWMSWGGNRVGNKMKKTSRRLFP